MSDTNMASYVSISEVKRNPAVLSRVSNSGVTIVMKNNRPLYVTVPYVEGLEDAIEDAMMSLNPKFLESLDAAEAQVRSGKAVTLSALKARLRK